MDHRQPQTTARLFHGPDWRRTLAKRAAQGDETAGVVCDDELIRQATMYYRVCDGDLDGPQRAARLFPDIHAAAQVWNSPATWLRFQQLVLAEFSRPEIAAQLGLSEAVVELVELIAFDVRPELRSTAWIMTSVVRPLEEAGEADRGVALTVAYLGGRTAVESFLNSRDGPPVAAIEQLAQAILLLSAKAKLAASIPLTGAQVLEFMRIAADFRLEEQRLALRWANLKHRIARRAKRR